MGASNFHYVNASKVYYFGMCDNHDECEYEYHRVIGEVRESLPKIYPNSKFIFGMGSDPHELRSYPSSVIGTLCTSTEIAGCDITVYATIVARSGYYEGACLDYHMWTEVDGSVCDIDEIIDEDAIDWIKQTNDNLSGSIEKLFTIEAQQMIPIATFSNGETVYKSIN